MRQKHNILLVTNDHVDTLKQMADNTVIVSAIDRTKVTINEKGGVDRDTALLARIYYKTGAIKPGGGKR
jgi:hypothetical protein